MKRIWRKVYAYLNATGKLAKVSVSEVVRGVDGKPKLDLLGMTVTETHTRPMTRQEFGVLQRDAW